MFTELMPLLGKRTVMLTITRIDENTIRANFIPVKSDEKTEANALNQPLTITGTPAELDRELPAQLSAFTTSILETGSTLERLKKEHDAAIKALEAENKKKLEDKRGKGKSVPPSTTPAKPGVEFLDGKPVFPGATPAAKPRGLFDADTTETDKTKPAAEETTATEEEEEEEESV